MEWEKDFFFHGFKFPPWLSGCYLQLDFPREIPLKKLGFFLDTEENVLKLNNAGGWKRLSGIPGGVSGPWFYVSSTDWSQSHW